MNLPLLELLGVEKRFGFHNVLSDINLKLDDGEFVLLLGNNGAGKSTLLRIFSTLMNPSRGQLLFRGNSLQQQRKNWLQYIGSMSHESHMYGDLNARENLKVYGTLHGLTGLKQRIDCVLEETNLYHAADLPVRTYSNGMKKRLMIGRLMLIEPKFLILDEPFTGLDQKSVSWFRSYLVQFHQHGGTVILVTHQIELGLELATRILVLQRKTIMHDLKAISLNPAQCAAMLEE